MSPEAQRIAIAEFCGLKDPHMHKWCGSGDFLQPVYTHLTGRIPSYQLIPDYLNDLNAMHEAENLISISGPGSGIYRHHLEEVCKLKGVHPYLSPAPERAEALLKTIGKWTE